MQCGKTYRKKAATAERLNIERRILPTPIEIAPYYISRHQQDEWGDVAASFL